MLRVEQLRQYTVRIKTPETTGTGFFVASGLILTCAHVVVKAKDKSINILWQDKSYSAVIDKLPENPENVDLALLTFSETAPDRPWVTLDAQVQLGDKLYTFGYPDNSPNGDPCEFECVGLTGDNPPLLKFKQGQVRPGLSGSPLLNVRTGKVCGIVKKTRGRDSDLGGRAVPATVIFNCFPELKPPQPLILPPNPFVPLVGRVEEGFFGREKEIKSVFDILNGGSSVAIIGEREIGKSSLLWAIYLQAERQLRLPRKPIYLNLQQVYDEEDFYEALCSEVGIDICKGYRLKRALSQQQPRLLLVLDEIEKMTWEGFTNQLRGQLRGLAEGSDAPLRLVVAASTSLDTLFPDSRKVGMTSPFQGICIEERIKPWDETIAREFIRQRLAETPIRFPEEEIVRILGEFSGRPKELMQLCNQAYKCLVEAGFDEI